MEEYKKQMEYWLSDPYFDEDTKAELLGIKDDIQELKERFYKDLEFGTAGLRGIVGPGTNRMNIYTVRRATQGLANYIIQQDKCEMGVAIAYDSRYMSKEFADEAALCLNANGIKTYVFEELRPTPELSFTVRELHCVSAINITASHNPPEYNGYKVYWEDGAQVTSPHDTGIMQEVEKIKDYSIVKTMELSKAQSQGLYISIGEELDKKYIEAIKSLVRNKQVIAQEQEKLNIVYTPLHGAGNISVRRVLRELGFQNVHVVKEQEMPDGGFPTVSYPNPESEEAFVMAIALAKEMDGDIVLATDPDGDRIGVHVKDNASGNYIPLTGNMSACLLAEYELSQLKELGQLPQNGAVIKTVVSTKMIDAITAHYGVELYEVLTGFKHIGRQILEFEEKGSNTYLFGFEESYGILLGTYARDKDGVSASMAFCETAAYYKSKNMTLWDAMLMLYEKYGYYKDEGVSVTLKGIDGTEKIKSIMENLRNNPPKQIGGYKVTVLKDFQESKALEISSGKTSPITLPKSNVLHFELTDDSWVAVRPSGTEPKIKLYYGVKGSSMEDAREKSEKLGNEAVNLIK